jgi:hypothetical protein
VHIRSIGTLLVFGIGLLSLGAVVDAGDAIGYFSTDARLLNWGNTSYAPDNKVNAKLGTVINENDEAFPAHLTISTPARTQTFTVTFTLNAEILWSPDSAALAISGSQDGASGQYFADVIVLKQSGFERLALSTLIQEAFGHPVVCYAPSVPNVAAVKWLSPSQQLLVVAEVYPNSNCDSLGTFRAYVLDIATMSILKTLDQLQTKAEFGSALGPELRAANDDCIRDPRACFVPFNHPDLFPREKRQ